MTENGTLKGYITMAVLLTHQPDTPVADLLREMEEMLREVCHIHSAIGVLRNVVIIGTPSPCFEILSRVFCTTALDF